MTRRCPEVFDHGRLGPAILFNVLQVGAYMTVVLIVPRASPETLRFIAVLALGTAVSGAALALVQGSARRAAWLGAGRVRLWRVT